jgi:hypothetical protein
MAHNGEGHADKLFDGTPLVCYWWFEGRFAAFDSELPRCPVRGCGGPMVGRSLPDDEDLASVWACT